MCTIKFRKFFQGLQGSSDKSTFFLVPRYPYYLTFLPSSLKAGHLPSKKIIFICFNESPLKMMKNAFCFILKGLFFLKIFKFLSWFFGHVEETA